MLATLVALLAAATIAVPLSRRAGFGSVLGYLVAGIAIGPGGLRLVTNVDEIANIASLGVVMLLFLIGLELRPQRLWVMRRTVFGLGTAQLVLCGGALAAIAHAAGIGWAGGVVVGAGLAMSSTAIVLPLLSERELLQTRAGRDGFAVLLFQDLAFIPLVALVPLLSGHSPDHVQWRDVARAALAVVAILAGGRFLMQPLFRAIGGARTPEVFTTVALLIVIGTALLATQAGLSPSLGAFMAGVLLSGSEYRHELEADIAPFEGLLLGFFFISVGMSADLSVARTAPLLLLGGTAALLGAKLVILYGLARIARQDRVNALRFALALPQASEFSFVLFEAAVAVGALDLQASRMATLVAAASMLATPIMFAGAEAWVIPRLRPKRQEPQYDKIENEANPVIIAGFGRMGQIVGRILRLHNISFTALERDPGQVDVVRRFGNKVYFGDPTRAEVLRAAGAEQAKLLVVLLDNMQDVLRTVDVARRDFPDLKILARARNRRHAHLLMDRGVDGLVRETFHSSLVLAEQALTTLGIDTDAASRAVALFRDQDEKTLLASHAFYRDEQKLIQSTQDAMAELESVFEADRER
jgi:CPA2 family monovalent cation:H+ antiporter-2/glutathione-regulated potassium-efflux system protein KefB